MKSSWEMLRGRMGLTVVGMLAFGAMVSACGGDGSGDNEAPYISDALVTCEYSEEFATNVWDFVAQVDDANGYEDVTSVEVDVYNVGGEDALETWPLVYDGNGTWSQTVYEYTGEGNAADYTQALDCGSKASFEFGFFAEDAGGEQDSGIATAL